MCIAGRVARVSIAAVRTQMGKDLEMKRDDMLETEKTASRKVTCKERQQAFIEAYGSPPYPTIAEAAAIAGYDDEYARRLKNEPHIAEAISARIAQHRKGNDRGIAQVEEVLRKKAVGEIPSDNPEKNAELYLEANGVLGRGTKIVVSQTQTNTPLDEKLKTAREDRFAGILPKDE